MMTNRVVVLDESKMLGKIAEFPAQLSSAWTSAWAIEPNFDNAKINKILICAMGGSAIAGHLLKELFKDSNKFIEVWSDYQLPNWADENTLVVAISYSGDTEETLDAYKLAGEKHLPRLAITGGGALLEMATVDKTPLLKISYEAQPRAALGWLYGSLLKAICQTHIIEVPENIVLDSINKLKTTIDGKTFFAKAEELAVAMSNKVPLIISFAPLNAVGKRIANQVNENSKTLGLSVVMPEACHNLLVGLDNPIQEKLYAIQLESKYSFSRNVMREKVLQKLLKEQEIQVVPISVISENLLTEQLLLIHFGDLLSYFLAGVYTVDPTPVDIIGKLKKMLAEA